MFIRKDLTSNNFNTYVPLLSAEEEEKDFKVSTKREIIAIQEERIEVVCKIITATTENTNCRTLSNALSQFILFWLTSYVSTTSSLSLMAGI